MMTRNVRNQNDFSAREFLSLGAGFVVFLLHHNNHQFFKDCFSNAYFLFDIIKSGHQCQRCGLSEKTHIKLTCYVLNIVQISTCTLTLHFPRLKAAITVTL